MKNYLHPVYWYAEWHDDHAPFWKKCVTQFVLSFMVAFVFVFVYCMICIDSIINH